jgi:hypothetical protein
MFQFLLLIIRDYVIVGVPTKILCAYLVFSIRGIIVCVITCLVCLGL